MPRSRDLVIFVLIVTTDNRQTDCFTPYCACTCGVTSCIAIIVILQSERAEATVKKLASC